MTDVALVVTNPVAVCFLRRLLSVQHMIIRLKRQGTRLQSALNSSLGFPDKLTQRHGLPEKLANLNCAILSTTCLRTRGETKDWAVGLRRYQWEFHPV